MRAIPKSDFIDVISLQNIIKSMKVTVDIPDSELAEVCRFTGESKKGPAILKMVNDALMMKRRARLSQKFISGEWGVELAGFEGVRAKDQIVSDGHSKAWRK